MQQVAVNLPEVLFKAVEKNRQQTGISRSEYIRRAVQEYVYVQGYINCPESEEEIALSEAALRLMADHFATELPWECD
jgi:metal-responsive CopG/Arc/MetJ family transcriptional regulator